jgi:hypothetical protein
VTVTEAVTLTAAIAAALVSVIGALAGLYTAQKAASTHALVNGLSGDLKDAARAQGFAEGQKNPDSAPLQQPGVPHGLGS